jgi:hypothetical protein
MAEQIVGFISLLLMTSVAGTLFGLRWGMSRFPKLLFMQADQELVKVFQKEIPVPCFATIGATALLAILVRHHAVELALSILACLCMVLLVFITVRFLAPINANELLKWPKDDPPRGWEEVMARWRKYNALRTDAAVVGFLALAVLLAFYV